MAAAYVRRMIDSKILNDRLYDLIGEGKNAANDINTVMEFKPAAGFYVVKDVTKTELTIEEYLKNKPYMAFEIDSAQGAALAIIHFAPENITKRMNFEPVRDEEEKTDEETEDEAAS